MKARLSLRIVFIISIAGLLFSGYLSYSELVQKACIFGGCTFVLGLPSCVYGFIMYLAVLIISLLGIMSKK